MITQCIRWSFVLIFAGSLMGIAADLPDKMQMDIERGKQQLDDQFQEAKQSLLGSFDKEISQARTAPKLTAEEKQKLIGNLEAEKVVFEKLGGIPFSPNMREHSIAYLNKIQKAEMNVSKIYDRAIEFHTKQKNDDDARKLIAEKKEAITPKVVAKWQVTLPKPPRVFTWALSSDGSIGPRTWTLDQRHLVIRSPDKTAPGGFWIDTCVISVDGMQFEAKNQNGYRFSAKRIIAE